MLTYSDVSKSKPSDKRVWYVAFQMVMPFVLAIIRQTLCNGRNQRDSQYLSVNFIQISIDGENLGMLNIILNSTWGYHSDTVTNRARSDGLERGLSADESLDWTVWSLSSGQCPAVHVHKKENTTSIKLENPVEDSLIHDQMISNVKFDRLIRIEIKWNKVSGKQVQLENLKISNFPEMKIFSIFYV